MSLAQPTPPRLPQLPPRNWFLRSKQRAYLFSVLLGVVVFAVAWSADIYYRNGNPAGEALIFASDLLGAVCATLATATILGKMIERAEAVRLRLGMIAEMNHHVRNALYVISLSAYKTGDEPAIAAIRDATQRIEWALTEILGPAGEHSPPSQRPQEPGLRLNGQFKNESTASASSF